MYRQIVWHWPPHRRLNVALSIDLHRRPATLRRSLQAKPRAIHTDLPCQLGLNTTQLLGTLWEHGDTPINRMISRKATSL